MMPGAWEFLAILAGLGFVCALADWAGWGQ